MARIYQPPLTLKIPHHHQLVLILQLLYTIGNQTAPSLSIISLYPMHLPWSILWPGPLTGHCLNSSQHHSWPDCPELLPWKPLTTGRPVILWHTVHTMSFFSAPCWLQVEVCSSRSHASSYLPTCLMLSCLHAFAHPVYLAELCLSPLTRVRGYLLREASFSFTFPPLRYSNIV